MEIKAALAEALRCIEKARGLYPPKSEVELSALKWELYAALQNFLDAVAMLVSDLGLRKPASYSELGGVLVEAGLATSELKETIATVAKARNSLAHAYRRISLEDLGALIEGLLPAVVRSIEVLLRLSEDRGLDPHSGIESREADRLQQVFRKHGVLIAYLFGSRARGAARVDSDYDIAVLFGREVTLTDEIGLSLEIAKALLEPPEKVDVVALDRADPLLKLRVLREGKLLYALSDEYRRVWERRTYVEALAELDFYSVYLRRALKLRVKTRDGTDIVYNPPSEAHP
ncbi:MAG: HepT-like ribonuclease domain-containing protein [Thermofilaceae archaeon]